MAYGSFPYERGAYGGDLIMVEICKNTKTNETVTVDRGTQSAPVAPAGVVRRDGAPSARPEKGKEV